MFLCLLFQKHGGKEIGRVHISNDLGEIAADTLIERRGGGGTAKGNLGELIFGWLQKMRGPC